jgi:hypothetical protein
MNKSIYLGRREDNWLTEDTENSFLPPEDTGERCSQCDRSNCWATLSVGARTAETVSESRLHCSNDPATRYRRRKHNAQAYTLFRSTARGIRALRKWREPDRRFIAAKYTKLPSSFSVGKLLPDL